MSELSGVMDCAGAGGYSNCDLDEEVHFSRDMFNRDGSCRPPPARHQPQRSVSITIDQINPTVLMNNNNVKFTDINLAAQNPENHDERIRSSRILNTIGSKLRRGSNYLVAPKLIGQYLLGITIQSWPEFMNTSRMLKAPSNTQQLARRVLANLSYFQGNYLCVSFILIIYCILTSPLLLLAIIGYILALYFITSRSATGRPIRILNYKPNLQQQYSFMTIVSIPLLWVAGAPNAFFWVVGASIVVVGIHAAMYNNDRLYQTFNELNQTNCDIQAHSLPCKTQNLYYNHYPTTNQYLTVPSALPPVSAHTSRKSLSTSSWAHWVLPFASSSPRGSIDQSASISDSGQHSKKSSNMSQEKEPTMRPAAAGEVMIISNDYAGLGRVYEV